MNYNERRAALIEYLKAKTQERDWHAVSDAANDLRVMEAGRMYISPMPPHADVRIPIDNRKSPLDSLPYVRCSTYSQHGRDQCTMPQGHAPGEHCYRSGY